MFHIFLMLFVIFSLLFFLMFHVFLLGLLIMPSLNFVVAFVGRGVVLIDLGLGGLALVLELCPNFGLEFIHLISDLSLNFLIDKISNSLSHVGRHLRELLSLFLDKSIWSIVEK